MRLRITNRTLLLLAILLASLSLTGARAQNELKPMKPGRTMKVTFRFTKTNGQIFAQPILPLQFRVEADGPLIPDADLSQCEVYNQVQQDGRTGLRLRCQGTEFRVTGYLFVYEQ
jgi:hypothetical protein